MWGILVALLLSWLLLFLFERRSLLALGLFPLPKRLQQLGFGFLLTAILCAGVELLEMVLKGSAFRLNEGFSLELLSQRFWWDLKSVVTEELIFRGALLFILIKRLGTRSGMLLSAAAFGVYHWFSFGIFGNIFPMLIVFLGTGLMGYAWALAFSRSRSIFMPIGLHLGWNFTFNTIFSKGPLGAGVLLAEGGTPLSDWFSLVGLWLVPVVVLLIINNFVPAEEFHKQKTDTTKLPLV